MLLRTLVWDSPMARGSSPIVLLFQLVQINTKQSHMYMQVMYRIYFCA
jgi:hypothetical protein